MVLECSGWSFGEEVLGSLSRSFGPEVSCKFLEAEFLESLVTPPSCEAVHLSVEHAGGQAVVVIGNGIVVLHLGEL